MGHSQFDLDMLKASGPVSLTRIAAMKPVLPSLAATTIGDAVMHEGGNAIDAIRRTVEAMEAEADALESRAAKLRFSARDLRELYSLLEETRDAVVQGTSGVDTPQNRVTTSSLIVETLATFQGLTFNEICNRVIPRVRSKATNKRKLIHSTLDYLTSGDTPRVEMDGNRYYLADRRDR